MPTVGVMPMAEDASPARAMPPLDALWREMEWCCLLEEAWDTCCAEDMRAVAESLRVRWAKMAHRRSSLPASLWEMYEAAAQNIAAKAGIGPL